MQDVGVSAYAVTWIDDPCQADAGAQDPLALDAGLPKGERNGCVDRRYRHLGIADQDRLRFRRVQHVRRQVRDDGRQTILLELDANGVAGPLVEPEQDRRSAKLRLSHGDFEKDADRHQPTHDDRDGGWTELGAPSNFGSRDRTLALDQVDDQRGVEISHQIAVGLLHLSSYTITLNR